MTSLDSVLEYFDAIL